MTLKERQTLLDQITLFINSLSVEDETKTMKEDERTEKIELLTVNECTRVIDGLSECTVRQLVKQNKLPHIRSGAGKRGKILIPKTALLEYFGG